MTRSFDPADLPVGPGVALGAGLWAVGYAITYLVTSERIGGSLLRGLLDVLGVEVPVWKVVGWVFFNAHGVVTNGEHAFVGATNYLGGEGFTVALYLVAPVLLVAGGALLARYTGTGEAVTGALAGVALTPGYLLATLLALAFLPVAGVGPEVVPGVVLTGLVYPSAFGGLGGVVVALVGTERTAARPADS